MKIIKIEGVRGLLTAFFVGLCLFAGFVIFPGYLAMSLWNRFLTVNFSFPALSIIQGVLLWGIIYISYSIAFKGPAPLSLQDAKTLSDAELRTIIQKAKIDSHFKTINSLINSRDTFEHFGKDNLFKNLKNNDLSKSDKNENESDSEDSYRKLG